MKIPKFLFPILSLVFFASCIGEDIIQDEVEPTIRIQNPLDTLAINTSYQFEYRYLNNVGREETVPVNWTSSNPSIVSIDQDGLAIALESGTVDIGVSYDSDSQTISDVSTLNVGMETVITESENRTGTVNTTSSYALSGDFVLEKNDSDELVLTFDNDYEASTALPGLYIYLTNNPNTTEEALEIGAVTVFSGAHDYNLGTDIDLFEYSHVLYFCKPFNVKVGDGAIE
ncbi:MAG: hypothetical protein AB8F74_00765 [Saprospiraceae bacterium]